MTTLYHSDHAGNYTHQTEARRDPIAGEPMVPAGATLTAPPSADNKIARWDDATGKWSLVADHRGQYWTADGGQVEITESGVSPPVGATKLTAGQELIQVGVAWHLRTSATELAAVQHIRIQVLKAKTAEEIKSGFESSALGAMHKYDSEQHNIDWIQAATLSGAATKITCDDGKGEAGSKTPREHTAAQCKTVLADGMAALLSHKTKFRTLRDQVNAAADVAAVEAITW